MILTFAILIGFHDNSKKYILKSKAFNFKNIKKHALILRIAQKSVLIPTCQNTFSLISSTQQHTGRERSFLDPKYGPITKKIWAD